MKDGLRGVCVFTRRQTSKQGQRGFRLSSLDILLPRSLRPRPRRYVPILKALVRNLHSDLPAQGDSSRNVLAPGGGADAWYGSSEEIEFSIDNGGVEDSVDAYEHYTYASPTLYLLHLLRVLGPSSLTLYEHVLGRRRILIIRICPSKRRFLCQVVADMYFEDDSHDPGEGPNIAPELTEVRERKEKVVKPEDPDDPTSNCVFCTLLPISAPLQHSSTARRGDPRAPTS
ncbi:hypothetical protein EDB84DRAFT_1569126 [Lactarius hengduanensis]|nr:hypothetical protein EDB84DRAFT_1569126 [Lactarius hengduanensis]